MADITFTITSHDGNRADGRLRWPAKGLDSPAVSGPHGKGALPTGEYIAQRSKLLDRDGMPAYCDPAGSATPQGHCWFQVFDDADHTDRTDLGVHPDGNVAGTEGCIGLQDKDTKPWYDAFYAVSGSTTVEVRNA
ncbi:hypothetical protein [Alienimonas chondri]|uniref:DUF2778 domain-containing protein n=1 Tax=Alienimonas chondri TaxID=2681879 RepID=A0ABX1VAY9_9PLAN|nr:hypothetical protein [Alienimonas chondri]NNJ24650.1 hypothetical protein [Alienimonas chondri]